MATTINAGRVRFVSRGTYNNSTQYYLFDLVDYNGSSYIAKENTVGNLPTNTQYWQLIAEKGNTGSTGQTGPVGATGNGIASITKTATVGLVDTYTITYTNGNTTTFIVTNGEDGEVTETELNVLRQKVANQQKVIDQLPQVEGQGTSITLENTIEAQFTKFDVEGNSVQDGTPSPDNEVPIYSAGDNGSITEKIVNRNWFNKNTIIEGKYIDNNGNFVNDSSNFVSDFIKLLSIDTNLAYRISATTARAKRIVYYDNSKTFISRQSIYTTQEKLNIPENASYVRLSCYNDDLESLQLEIIEEGSTATPYVPHEEQDYSIPVQQPFRSIGDVRDCFVKKDDGWYERHYIARKIYKGGNDEYWVKATEDTNTTRFYIEISNITNGLEDTMQPKIKSNYFKPVTFRAIYSNDEPCIAQYGGTSDSLRKRIYLRIEKTIASTIADLKTWLSTHNLELIYELAEPLDLPCTEEQIQQLENKPSTYKEMTIINSEDETPAYLEVSGIYDLNNLINN